MLTIKHSKEALAFWTLFKAMKPEIKKEVRDMMLYETSLDNGNEVTTDMMTAISLESFQEVWEGTENEHWDDFIKDRLQCTNKGM
ncbi:hypothetical protein [Mucilaginibacter ginsenosidivorans]|uniref:Uncharacterized protein n=1 Tax=Mucilaginibacter ginsenosidivorans TaxID=398053 RepID=A0A5B8UVL5_9SPHI|nr:hypothetical protein [Mucilaginibacter ginsenosidivorans]QEC63104.1 hypothetical protein FRZ54_11120 [Mucilaginibacter ginsenosidivorans]